MGGRSKVDLRATGNARPRFKEDSIGKSVGSLTLRKAGQQALGQANWLILHCQEKPLVSYQSNRTADRHR
jgi:hypothetical protein